MAVNKHLRVSSTILPVTLCQLALSSMWAASKRRLHNDVYLAVRLSLQILVSGAYLWNSLTDFFHIAHTNLYGV